MAPSQFALRSATDGCAQPSVCIAFAHGCPRTEIDTAKLYPYFEANGWRIEDRLGEADLVLVTTCGADINSEEDSMAYLAQVDSRRRSDSGLVVLGCLAGINGARITESLDAKAVPPLRLYELDELIDATVPLAEVADENCVQPYIVRAQGALDLAAHDGFWGRAMNSTHDLLRSLGLRHFLVLLGLRRRLRDNLEPTGNVFNLRVAYGCMGTCTYCAIKFAAGPLRSKPLEGVLSEFDAGLESGHRECKIVAGDIGPYGQDIGMSVVDLFRGLFERQADFRLTLLDLGPEWFVKYRKELTELFVADSHRIRLLMCPVQSGSDGVLQRMQRRYAVEETKACLLALREAAPDISIATHALVGFPGETEADFQATLEFLRTVQFARVDVFEYGDRPNTEASRMPDKVPDAVKRERATLLVQEFGAEIQNETVRKAGASRRDVS